MPAVRGGIVSSGFVARGGVLPAGGGPAGDGPAAACRVPHFPQKTSVSPTVLPQFMQKAIVAVSTVCSCSTGRLGSLPATEVTKNVLNQFQS
jgi:hypothetical protein